MNRRQVLEAVGTAATASLVGLAGCSDSNPGTGNGTSETNEGNETAADSETTATSTPTVQMVTASGAYYFDPIGLFVEPGTTVTWRIESGSHSSTAYKDGNGGAAVTRIPSGAAAWDSGILGEQGATFEHTFETQGTYDYFCTPHKSLEMVGRLVVGEPGGPAEGSMPPDGEVPASQRIVDQKTVSYEAFSE
ncbi:plastocyanin/azurin family copper-binding protein [Halomarina litorea]|uniref:plastocyanin/azurin family copper-binding protein n=1 Tax=Halomarina litorea TaxID=2961595 RepID=UPI0020C2C17B|nr:plastocyanin/azurin family copper-binding protein [Halomarina sp. BCD28]